MTVRRWIRPGILAALLLTSPLCRAAASAQEKPPTTPPQTPPTPAPAPSTGVTTTYDKGAQPVKPELNPSGHGLRNQTTIGGTVRFPGGLRGKPPQIVVAAKGLRGYSAVSRGPEFAFVVSNVDVPTLSIAISAKGHQTVLLNLASLRRGELNWYEVQLGPRLAEGQVAPGDPANSIDVASLGIPEKARKLFEGARKEIDRGNGEKALELLRSCLEAYPRFYQAHNEIAAIYLTSGRRAEAEQAARDSLAIAPDGAFALKALGFALLVSKREAEAVPVLTRAIERNPRDAAVLTYLGEALYQVRKFAEAEEPLRRALELDTGSAVARYRLGYVYVELKRFPEALSVFREYLRKAPSPQPKVAEIVTQLEKASAAAP
jgi:Flp pilus assembly protein TadD